MKPTSTLGGSRERQCQGTGSHARADEYTPDYSSRAERATFIPFTPGSHWTLTGSPDVHPSTTTRASTNWNDYEDVIAMVHVADVSAAQFCVYDPTFSAVALSNLLPARASRRAIAIEHS